MEVYTVQEVAEKLKVDPETIRRYINDGKLKASKLGNRYRITDVQIREFLKDTETEK